MKSWKERCRIKWFSPVQMVRALREVGEIYKVCFNREPPYENFLLCALSLYSLWQRANVVSTGPISRHINVARQLEQRGRLWHRDAVSRGRRFYRDRYGRP